MGSSWTRPVRHVPTRFPNAWTGWIQSSNAATIRPCATVQPCHDASWWSTNISCHAVPSMLNDIHLSSDANIYSSMHHRASYIIPLIVHLSHPMDPQLDIHKFRRRSGNSNQYSQHRIKLKYRLQHRGQDQALFHMPLVSSQAL